MNNIYDLEGNNREWTAQAYKSSDRTLRGGYFNYVNNDNRYEPASSRSSSGPRSSVCYICTRVTLYL